MMNRMYEDDRINVTIINNYIFCIPHGIQVVNVAAGQFQPIPATCRKDPKNCRDSSRHRKPAHTGIGGHVDE